MIVNDLEYYYLDLCLLKDELDKDRIHTYYNDMIFNCIEGRYSAAQTMLNTLLKSKYLKDMRIEERDTKLGDIING